ncbi:MAG: Hsp33 family molecular chaperone HslO [Clostridia bacterium]|nr:Hsp33 family molecular chaperone HslO [Clostridia bacterium]
MKKSYITRAITQDGSARIFCTDSTSLVDRAVKIHKTSKTCAAVLGRALTATSLMGSLLKDRDNSLTFQIKGDGPAGTVVCVSDYSGNVRGYVQNPEVELPENKFGKLDVGGAVGKNGYVYVTKDLGLAEPYNGVSPIVTGEIGDDVTEYFASSEQTPSACALGVRVSDGIDVIASGGFLVQIMPGADSAVIDRIEANLKLIPSVSAMIKDSKTPEEIIEAVFKDIPYDVFDSFDTDYKCTCSREKYLKALISLPDKDIEELKSEDAPIETECRFCKQKYTFDISEIINNR